MISGGSNYSLSFKTSLFVDAEVSVRSPGMFYLASPGIPTTYPKVSQFMVKIEDNRIPICSIVNTCFRIHPEGFYDLTCKDLPNNSFGPQVIRSLHTCPNVTETNIKSLEGITLMALV